jgi:tripartite ATP-independent transporter DctM subunit
LGIELITVLMVATMVVLMIIGMPLAFVTGFVAVVFCLIFRDFNSLVIVASRTYGFVNTYVLVAVPMFILMASILERSGVAHDLYNALRVWAGRLRGGVGVMTLLAAVLMAAMTGIIGGEIILLGLVALPQMIRLGYDRRLAIGIVCGGGSLGTMIPPSIVLIFYGLTANVSIGDLFIATLVPGLLLAGIYTAYVLIRCALNRDMGPPAPPEERDIPIIDKLRMLKGVLLPILVGVLVLGSIYTGAAAVSEAAAVGVAGVILSAWLRGELSWKMLREASYQTMSTCGLLIWLTFGANSLIGVYNLLGGIAFLKSAVAGLPFEPVVIVLIMMLVLILMGFFMDWIGIMLLTMPVFVPAIVALGYDPIWFGILFCMNMQISYLTPPFGPACFYLKGVAPPDISLEDIFKAVTPFIGLQILGLLLVLFFPEIALWLPRLFWSM